VKALSGKTIIGIVLVKFEQQIALGWSFYCHKYYQQ